MKAVLIFFAITISFFNFSIEKKTYYDALSSKTVEPLDLMINQLEKEKSSPLNSAYKGTLIAKKAGFVKGAGEKLKLFKAGVKLLEDEIKKDPKETEYRFLRLTIQENCPKILKYGHNIEEDKAILYKNYKSLSKELQQVISDYAKTSDVLSNSNLN